MPSSVIQAEYDVLSTSAQQFATQAVTWEHILSDLQKCLEYLREGGWHGQGADAFFAEMEGEVLPASKRLKDALYQAEEAIKIISQRFANAEMDAAALFKNGTDMNLPNPGIMEDLRTIRDGLGELFNADDLDGAKRYLEKREAAKDLINRLKENKLGIKLPDGTILGDPNGTIIPAVYDDADISDAVSAAAYYTSGDPETGEGPKIVISSEFMGSDSMLAAIIAHETQHALDDHQGILHPEWQTEDEQITFDNIINPEFQEGLEKDIENSVEARVASEVRAYIITDAMRFDHAYQDDGVTTTEEKQKILDSYRYEALYEEQYSKMLSEKAGYPVEVEVQLVDGKVEVEVQVTASGGGSRGAW